MTNSPMQEDLRRVEDLEATGVALSRFAESLAPGGTFVKQGRKWIYRPNNFVTFEVQPRASGIVITLRGGPEQFRARAEAFGFKDEYVKNLNRERAAYSRYPVRNPGQLLAAAQFIRWAFDNSNKRG